ncbi:cryptochrome-1-like isoform X3 [Gossypium australe]|uniref:Cryptochrome-1-like isoform X3 n=1 Tax=Gossypium australe TaxID=47621 RepID=A0A5B6WUT4_9ROSI|nr:cryptochrome-1-like isoform X3 [Gossypium australe]
MSSGKTIVWFRGDLRIEDNPALAAAARDGSVFPVYIWCPEEEGQFYPGRVSQWWLKQSLAHLEQSLKSLGAELVMILPGLNPVSLVRDHSIKEKLAEVGISVESYNGDLLYEPWEIYDEEGRAFSTFVAYWDKCTIEGLGLENELEKSSNVLLGRGCSLGWSNADKALTEFVEQNLFEYSKSRFKILWRRDWKSQGEESVTLFLKAIGLREYSRYLCFNYPFTHERSLLSNMKYFPWNADANCFKVWRQGRTGYPLVDAGMRELWATGWIHNKIRVIVSSFTISGSLPDGQELEQLHCLQIQGSKFDPEGEYVRQWLPELARMPIEWIHHPWDAPLTVLKAAGVELGLNYPKPIIDMDTAREHLREAIFKVWEMEAAAKSATSDQMNEDVFDNSDSIKTSAILKVIPKEKSSCLTYSSHDQRVPSFQNCNNGLLPRKRPLPVDEEKLHMDKPNKQNKEAGTSGRED